MPSGLLLRSSCDWHIDPLGVHTIDNYLSVRDLDKDEVEPIPLEFFLSYARWFQEEKGIETIVSLVHRLDLTNSTFAAMVTRCLINTFKAIYMVYFSLVFLPLKILGLFLGLLSARLQLQGLLDHASSIT